MTTGDNGVKKRHNVVDVICEWPHGVFISGSIRLISIKRLGASFEVDFMKRVSVLLPPISRAKSDRPRSDRERRVKERKGPFFSLFATSSHIFGAVPSLPSLLSSPITIAMSPKTRGVFSSPHFILLRRSPTDGQRAQEEKKEDDCDFANRFPPRESSQSQSQSPRSTCLFRHCSRKKGLSRGRGRREEGRCQATRLAANTCWVTLNRRRV